MDGLHRALGRECDPIVEGDRGLIDGRLLPDCSELVAQDVDFAERRICCQKRIKIGLLLGLQGALPGEEVVALTLDEGLVFLLCVMPRLSANGIDGRVVVGDDVELVEIVPQEVV